MARRERARPLREFMVWKCLSPCASNLVAKTLRNKPTAPAICFDEWSFLARASIAERAAGSNFSFTKGDYPLFINIFMELQLA
jgi:uncharacterized protein YlaI